MRQREIDQQLGPVGAREELLLHELHADERGDEQRDRAADHRISSCAARDRAACGKRGQSAMARGHGLFSVSGRMKTPVSGVNSTATTQEAISAIADDRKQREAILAGAARRKADRHEAGDGDQRAGQHRKGRGGVGEGRGA